MAESKFVKSFETTVVLTGKGKNERDCFIDAIGKMQRQVTSDIKGTIIRIEPLDVVFLEGKEIISTEKYFFFFMKRDVSHFTIKIEVKANVILVDTAAFEFTQERAKQGILG